MKESGDAVRRVGVARLAQWVAPVSLSMFAIGSWYMGAMLDRRLMTEGSVVVSAVVTGNRR